MCDCQQEMPKYQSHKQVHALKLKGIIRLDDGSGWKLEADGTYVIVHNEYVMRHQPQVGGYYVVYEDGYESWSPAKVFEAGYTRID
jgi:hypothetical protein